MVGLVKQLGEMTEVILAPWIEEGVYLSLVKCSLLGVIVDPLLLFDSHITAVAQVSFFPFSVWLGHSGLSFWAQTLPVLSTQC